MFSNPPGGADRSAGRPSAATFNAPTPIGNPQGPRRAAAMGARRYRFLRRHRPRVRTPGSLTPGPRDRGVCGTIAPKKPNHPTPDATSRRPAGSACVNAEYRVSPRPGRPPPVTISGKPVFQTGRQPPVDLPAGTPAGGRPVVVVQPETPSTATLAGRRACPPGLPSMCGVTTTRKRCQPRIGGASDNFHLTR